MQPALVANRHPQRRSALRGGLELIFLLLAALTVLVQANAATRSLGRDQGFYVYIGDEIVHGRLPYADAWESKPPAIFYLNALGIWLARGSRWGVWALELLFLAASLLLSYEFMRRRWGVWPAIFGTAAWMYGLDRTFYAGGNFTEEYCLPFHFLAIILMMELFRGRRRRLYSLAMGALFAAAFLFRPNNAAPEAAAIALILIVWILQRHYRAAAAGAALMALGAAALMSIPVLYFWSRGLLQELIDASILYHLAYVARTDPSILVLWNGLLILGAGVAVAAVGYALALYEARKQSDDKLLLAFLLIGWPITILTSDPAHKYYAHYYITWLPFMALLGAYALFWMAGRFPRVSFAWMGDERAALSISIVLTLAVFIVAGRADEYGRVLDRFEHRDKQGIEFRSPTALYAMNHTDPGESVLFWSAWPGENYMAERESPTAALYYPLYSSSDISTRLSQRFYQELVANKPVLIVDMGHLDTLPLDPVERQSRISEGVDWAAFPDNILQVVQYIDQNYHLVAVVKNRAVYRLNGTE